MNLFMLILMLNMGAAQPVEVAPGQELTVISEGTGEPVVLLPGLSGCAYGFRKIVPDLLGLGYRTVIIEPLGMGSSSRPQGADYTLTAQSDRVAAVMDRLEIKNAVIVGHGVSASVALRLAYRRPDLVGAVLSIEGGAYESAATPAMERSLKFAAIVARLGGGRLLRDKYKSNLEDASGDSSWIDRRTLGRYLKNIDRDLNEFIAALKAMAGATEPETLRENLHSISCPVLLLSGEAPHSGGLTKAEIILLEDGLPEFAVQYVPGAGHFIFEEQPVVVVDAIHSLINKERRLSCAQ
jgi:pimeloyl-ACP methyl ester carboxylesterase